MSEENTTKGDGWGIELGKPIVISGYNYVTLIIKDPQGKITKPLLPICKINEQLFKGCK